MAFKGKSTIELRNAETGELEQCVEDENMVTNAIANLMNPPLKYNQQLANASQAGLPAMGALLYPLISKAFKGIMLFDKNITEDQNNIIPNVSEMNQIGCASDGGNASIYPYRGVLNITESKDLENGYRFVWDFATDKANGTIRSIALTCPAAGYCGADNGNEEFERGIGTRFRGMYNSVPSDVTTTFGGYNNLAYYGKSVCNVYSGYNYPIGSFEPYSYLWLKYESANPTSYNFLKRKLDYGYVSLKQIYKQEDQVKTVTTKGAKLSQVPIADDNFIYSFFKTATDSFDFVKIDAKTFEIVVEKTIKVQDAAFKQDVTGLQGLEHDGYYYVADGYGGSSDSYPYRASNVYKINVEDYSDYTCIDLLSEGIITHSNSDVFMYKYSGMVLITQDYNGNTKQSYQCCVLNSDSYKKFRCYTYYSSAGSQNGKEIILPSPWLSKPFVLGIGIGKGSKYNQSMRFGFDTCYMATINNLSTPVVKNETQTMKVTYEITEI